MIARDSRGEIVGVLNRRSWSDGVEIMEAMAILEGVKLAIKKGCSVVEIESNSSVVIAQLKGATLHWRLRALLITISTTIRQVEQITWKAISRAPNECANWILGIELP